MTLDWTDSLERVDWAELSALYLARSDGLSRIHPARVESRIRRAADMITLLGEQVYRRMSIHRLVLLVALMACSTGTAAEEPKAIAPVDAIKQIGKPKVVVEMAVKKSKDRLEKRGIIFLDSEDDFKDEKNLGVAISAEAAAKFKEKGIADPAAHFLGKTIRVRGCVMRFEDRPYLPVHDPDQITVVEKK